MLIRRTTLAFETRDHGRAVAPRVAAILGAERKWTDAGIADALVEYEREVTRIFEIE